MSAPPPTQAELRAERLAEEEALRPSGRLALAAVGLWLAHIFVRAWIMPGVALRLSHGKNLVPTLDLDVATVIVCALFMCAVATARAPGGRGIVARDFVRLAFALALWTVASTAVELACAFVLGGATAPGEPAATIAVVVQAVFGIVTVVGGGGVALLWLGVAYEVAALPRGATREEVARVAHVAAPALVVVVLWTTRYARIFGSSPLVVIPPHVAVALTLSGVVVALAVWLRLLRPVAYGRGPVE